MNIKGGEANLARGCADGDVADLAQLSVSQGGARLITGRTG
jgi:hypothetical protein